MNVFGIRHYVWLVKVFRTKLNSSEKNFAVYIGTIFDLSIVEILFMSINLYMWELYIQSNLKIHTECAIDMKS